MNENGIRRSLKSEKSSIIEYIYPYLIFVIDNQLQHKIYLPSNTVRSCNSLVDGEFDLVL